LAADEAAITEFNRRYLQSINDADIDTLASLTTDGHMMISGGRPPLVGKQALVDAMNRVFARSEIDET
jgi:ketosteroid isomerase-like protein